MCKEDTRLKREKGGWYSPTDVTFLPSFLKYENFFIV